MRIKLRKILKIGMLIAFILLVKYFLTRLFYMPIYGDTIVFPKYHDTLYMKVFATEFITISSYQKKMDLEVDSLKDIIHRDLLYYALTDSSILIFDNRDIKIPQNFNSRVKIEFVKSDKNISFKDSVVKLYPEFHIRSSRDILDEGDKWYKLIFRF